MKADIDCLLCGKKAHLRHSNYPGYKEPQIFQIYHCAHCNTAFSMPRFVDTNEVYNLIYTKSDVVPGYNRYWEYSQHVKSTDTPLNYLVEKEDTYWSVREALIHNTVSNKKEENILEIGSGLGYLTYSLRKAGYNVCGLDISETAVELATKNFGNFFTAGDLFKYSKENKNKYDVIILTEVIEHVESPILFLEAALDLLKKGGKAIITTPNKSLYPSDILWESDFPPVHCWWFSEYSMEYIANKLKVELSFIDFTNFYKKPFWVNFGLIRNKKLPKSIFDKQGNLQLEDTTNANSEARKIFTRNAILKRFYYLIKKLTTADVIKLDRRGLILCAIFKK